MRELLEFMFTGFWKFFGCLILLAMCLNFVFRVWNRFWRHWSIRKHGYPPAHCDADGDFEKEDKE
jgi:hypothetical protein